MSLETLIEEFGYLAIAIGAFFEGETALALGGFFASREYLAWRMVVVTGFFGAMTGHLFWFWLGRRHGARLVSRFPRFEKKFQWFVGLFERHGARAVFVAQYMYGFRITTAIVFGVSRIPTGKFILYQSISTVVWAVLITSLGFYFGHAVQVVLGKAAEVERYGLIGIVVAALLIFLWQRRKERRADAVQQ